MFIFFLLFTFFAKADLLIGSKIFVSDSEIDIVHKKNPDKTRKQVVDRIIFVRSLIFVLRKFKVVSLPDETLTSYSDDEVIFNGFCDLLKKEVSVKSLEEQVERKIQIYKQKNPLQYLLYEYYFPYSNDESNDKEKVLNKLELFKESFSKNCVDKDKNFALKQIESLAPFCKKELCVSKEYFNVGDDNIFIRQCKNGVFLYFVYDVFEEVVDIEKIHKDILDKKILERIDSMLQGFEVSVEFL